MDNTPANLAQISATSKRITHRLLTIGENRVQLLLVELQEERERFLSAILLALGVVAFGLLAGVTLTLGVAVVCWEYHPVIALLVLLAIYTAITTLLYVRLLRLQRDWNTLPATLDQLRKDRECLEQALN